MSSVVRSEGGVDSCSIVGGAGEILQGKRVSKTSSVVMSRGDLLSNGSSLLLLKLVRTRDVNMTLIHSCV